MNIFPILLFLFVVDMLLYQKLLFIYFIFSLEHLFTLQTYSDNVIPYLINLLAVQDK